MATKLYFHKVAATSPGTLPASNVSPSATTPSQIADGTNYTMTTKIGTSQQSVTFNTLANTNAQPSLIARFVSPPLATGAIALSAGDVVVHLGGSEANAASNFQCKVVFYIWNPSGGAIRSLLEDLAGTSTAEAGTSETALSQTNSGIGNGFNPTDQDVFIIEIWRDSTAQSMGTSYANTIFFDGTTEDSTTSNAAYLNFPNDTLKFQFQGYGQAQAKIKATARGFGQAQAQISTFYQKNVLNDGAVYYARLNDDSGTVVPDYAGGSIGSYVNNPTLGSTGAISGDSTKSITLSAASNQYVNVPDTTALHYSNGPISWEIWYTNTSGSGTMVLMDKGGSLGIGTPQIRINQDAVGDIQWWSRGNAVLAKSSINTAIDSTFHHIICTKDVGDSGASHIYLDGVDVTVSVAGPGSEWFQTTNTAALTFGVEAGTGFYHQGQLDEPAIYNTVLTATQAQDHYTIGKIGALIRSGQAQVLISGGAATNRRYAQAQTDIKAIGRGFSQTQADIKAQGFGLGQSQVDIKAVGSGLGQAQADIKASGFGLGQASADIKAKGYGSGQAQSDIKASGFGLGQSQADIKAIGYGSGQANVDIKAKGFGLGQTQADIKKTQRGFAQANADILQTQNAFGQALGFVGYTTALDTYTRTITDGVGSADTGGPYSISIGTTAADLDVDGASLIISNAGDPAITDHVISLNEVGFSKTLETQIDYTIANLPASSKFYVLRLGQGKSSGTYGFSGAVRIASDGTIQFISIRSGVGINQTPNTITYVAGEKWTFKFSVYTVNTQTIERFKTWKTGTTEPDWQLTATFNTSGLEVSGLVITDSFADSSGGVTTYTLDNLNYSIITILAGLGQAKADIKQTYSQSAQAQAYIKAQKFGSGQAQSDIKATEIISAQAGARIGSIGPLTWVKDTFTRTISGQLGTPDIGPTYIDSSVGPNQGTIDVDGSKAVFVSPPEGFLDAVSLIDAYNVETWATISFIAPTVGTATAETDIAFLHRMGPQNTFDFFQYGYFHIYPTGVLKLGIQNSGGGGSSEITHPNSPLVPGNTYTYKFKFRSQQDRVYIKAWEISQTEPDWQLVVDDSVALTGGAAMLELYTTSDSSTFTIDNYYVIEPLDVKVGQAQADIKAVGFGSSQANSDIKVTTNQFAQAQADIKITTFGFANVQADVKQTYAQCAQAQVDIKTIYRAFGQANADIKSTIVGATGQAQADILTAGYGSGQGQADIKQIYRGFGQTNADIKAISNGYGQAQVAVKGNAFAQAQADIKTTYFGLAQSQADIKTTYNQFAQTQADIKAITNQFAQAQADIKAVGNGLGQANADIKQTYNQFAQSQADIKQTYVIPAQAQALIVRTETGSAQAQADIKTTYNGFAQSQADIKATSNGYGQAQATVRGNAFGQTQCYIKVTNINAYAQAQADVKATSNGYGQSQAYVKTVNNNVYAQTQADIKAVSNGYGQANSDIKQIGYGSGQALASILATYNSYGQANADILAVGYGFANTQADIKATSSIFGQTQADIRATYNGYAQAQADVKATSTVYAQAQTDIKAVSYGEAQAQAYLRAFNQNACGQAQVNIRFNGNAAFAQAQAKINAFGQDVFGQTQSDIKQTGL